MKRIITLVALAIAACTFAFGQVKRNTSVEAEVIAHEKRAFAAWKNKDKKFFLDTATDWSQNIDLTGVRNREQWAQAVTDPNCTVKNYALDNIKVIMLSPDTALMTYRYTNDAVCNGKPEPSPAWASTVLVKRGRKWLVAFHQETNAQAN